MPNLKYVPFSSDLLQAALAEAGDATVLIFPTKASASEAERRFFADWNFKSCNFVSVDEFKAGFVRFDLPLLQEDKRLLCLYMAMSQPERDYFHVYNYNDVIRWGQQYFRFFDELWEELLHPEQIWSDEQLSSQLSLQEWQLESLEHCAAIAANYLELIHSKGYSDRIFSRAQDHLELGTAKTRYVFVNQYYYSGLERYLIQKLEAGGNEVTLLFQGLEDSFDIGALKPKKLDLAAALQEPGLVLQELQIRQSPTEEQMILQLLQDLPGISQGEKNVVLDGSFGRKAYQHFVPVDMVQRPAGIAFKEIYLAALLQIILKDLKAMREMTWKSFLPLQNLLEASTNRRFAAHFSTVDAQVLIDQLLKLGEQNYLYIDLDLILFDLDPSLQKYPELKDYLKSYFSLLKQANHIKSVRDLIKLLAEEPLCALDKLLSEEEFSYTDAAEKFYDRLANLLSVEELGIVDDWSEVFAPDQIAPGLWELLLNSLKNLQCKRQPLEETHTPYTLSNLLDSRNQDYDTLVVLNALEGVLPSAPEPVWILNESQRGRLGLKTFSDVQAWERYYFFRLLLVCRRAHLYYYQNQEQNIESSSFISEIEALQMQDLLPSELVCEIQNAEQPELSGSIRHLYHARQKASKLIKSQQYCGLSESGQDFFNIPFEQEIDFGKEMVLYGTYYKLENFTKIPFLWYIQDHAGLQEPSLKMEQTITRKLFGTIIHCFMSDLMAGLAGKHKSYRVLDQKLRDKDLLYAEFVKLLENELWRYKIPQNYNWDFLRDVLADSIVETVAWFFGSWLPEILSQNEFVLIPEQAEMTRSESIYKELMSVDIPSGKCKVMIRAKADLRIECDDQAFIVDFKTGKASRNQLLLYELFYYLLDQSRAEEEISSYVCKLLEQDSEKVENPQKGRADYLEKIRNRLAKIVIEGYGLGEKASDRQRLRQITRADLFQEKGGQA